MHSATRPALASPLIHCISAEFFVFFSLFFFVCFPMIPFSLGTQRPCPMRREGIGPDVLRKLRRGQW